MFLDPAKILDELILRVDMAAADFGCGSGGFAIPLAKKIKEGIVYALDIQKEPLEVLKSRSIKDNINNIKIVKCDLETASGSGLENNSVNLALIINTLFQAENKEAVLSEAERILGKGGRILVIDWMPSSLQGPEKGRISSERVKGIIKELGLKFEKELDAGEFHYGLIFRKL